MASNESCDCGMNLLQKPIEVKKSTCADTRSCDYKNVTKVQLASATMDHMQDVTNGIELFKEWLDKAAIHHDATKLAMLDSFHKEFSEGFKITDQWLYDHWKHERHHLNNHVPEDVNLVDVVEMVIDVVMAAKGRGGKMFDIKIPDEVLQKAFANTIKKLYDSVEVIDE